MFDDTVPSKINEVMDRLEEAIERREWMRILEIY
jgi:hypothetical protein